jgi:hypothetical protein
LLYPDVPLGEAPLPKINPKLNQDAIGWGLLIAGQKTLLYPDVPWGDGPFPGCKISSKILQVREPRLKHKPYQTQYTTLPKPNLNLKYVPLGDGPFPGCTII